MAQLNFPLCPPRTIQFRTVLTRCGDPSTFTMGLRKLWRTDRCGPLRWHWYENMCRCGSYATSFNDYSRAGYRLQQALPESGTWRRDGYGIAAHLAKYRTEIEQQRQAAAYAKAAVGPRYVKKPLTFDLDLESRCLAYTMGARGGKGSPGWMIAMYGSKPWWSFPW